MTHLLGIRDPGAGGVCVGGGDPESGRGGVAGGRVALTCGERWCGGEGKGDEGTGSSRSR